MTLENQATLDDGPEVRQTGRPALQDGPEMGIRGVKMW